MYSDGMTEGAQALLNAVTEVTHGNLDHHLQNRAGTYYVAVRVPRDVVGLVGKEKEVRSLGTGDVMLARKLRDREMAVMRREWEDMRVKLGIVPKHLTGEEINIALQIAKALKAAKGREQRDGIEEVAVDLLRTLAEAEGRLEASEEARQIIRESGFAQAWKRFAADPIVEQRYRPATIRTYYRNSAFLREMFQTVEEVTKERVREVMLMYAKTHSKASVRALRHAGQALYEWLGYEEERNPFAVKVSLRGAGLREQKVGIFSRDELRAVMEVATPPMRRAIWIVLHSGLRVGELCALQYDEALDQLVVRMENAKTASSRRRVPCHPAIRETVKEWVAAQEGEKDPDGQLIRNASTTITATMSGLLLAARVQRVVDVDGQKMKRSFHSFRHQFASELRNRGVAIEQISSLMGHSLKGITDRYSGKVDPESLRKAVETLDWSDVWVERRRG